MKIVIIDYGSGNLRSAAKAFEKSAQDFSSMQVMVSNKADDVRNADKIILPGQGAFADCMQGLSAVDGMADALQEAVIKKQKPFFGICVGMQLLATRGYEYGVHDGLGWIDGEVRGLAPVVTDNQPALKIPHMGWNNLLLPAKPHALFDGLPADPFVYFVHSYAFYPAQAADSIADCDYGGRFCAAVAKDNMVATQFHPEKSQKMGLQLIHNFLKWAP
jgi:glutamine amidotransferase